jgi:hypothetical protein
VEGASVAADLLERAGERLDVLVGEMAGEVLFDPVPVVTAGLLHGLATLVGEDDEDRASVVLGADAAEGFLREVGEPATERVVPPPLETPPDMQRLLPIGARNGMNILGPPGPPPAR